MKNYEELQTMHASSSLDRALRVGHEDRLYVNTNNQTVFRRQFNTSVVSRPLVPVSAKEETKALINSEAYAHVAKARKALTDLLEDQGIKTMFSDGNGKSADAEMQLSAILQAITAVDDVKEQLFDSGQLRTELEDVVPLECEPFVDCKDCWCAEEGDDRVEGIGVQVRRQVLLYLPCV